MYPSKEVTDSRGNKVRLVDEDNGRLVRAAVIPQRSSKAELPGQQDLQVTRLIVESDLPNIDTWAQVEYNGHRWDVVVPPGLHEGSRLTRHWTIDVRRRP